MPWVFTDRLGREHRVHIDGAAVARVRDLAGVDLDALADDGCRELTALARNPYLLLGVVFLLTDDGTAEGLNARQKDFGRGLAGDAILAAALALVAALHNHAEDAARRDALSSWLAAHDGVTTAEVRRLIRPVE